MIRICKFKKVLTGAFMVPTLFLSGTALAGTFSIVAIPDTQYYNGSDKSFVFHDQMNWIKSNAAAYNIQLVLGLGDITDTGGPGASTCATPFPSPTEAPGPQWTNASAAYDVLDSANIPYMLALGNHDYDCHLDMPPPRSAALFNQYFGPSRYLSKSWFTSGQHGWYLSSSSENFYNTFTINGRPFLILVLEFFPRKAVLDWANTVVSSFPNHEVIVTTHAYLNYDTSGKPGSAPRLARGMGDSAASYFPTYDATKTPPYVTANNGIDMWTNFVMKHSNISTVLSGHIRSPGPGSTWLENNGVGYRVDNNTNGKPINQIMSDYQGQGANGYFGYGYLRIYTFDDTAKTLQVQTFSPAIHMDAAKIAAFAAPYGTPVQPEWKTDAYNKFLLTYEPLSAAGAATGVTVSAPLNGATVSSPVIITAKATESVTVSQMQVWIDGTKLGYYTGASVNTTATLSAGAHKISVLDLNSANQVITTTVVNITVK